MFRNALTNLLLVIEYEIDSAIKPKLKAWSALEIFVSSNLMWILRTLILKFS
jgi:hypothetical protein